MTQTNVTIKIRPVLLFTLYITTEELIFYADKIMVMGSSKNSRVFNFAILLKLDNFILAKYTCFTVYEGHRVKVKVRGAKKVENLLLFSDLICLPN